MQTDTIIERAKAKDPKALNEIYAMYYPKMVSVCMKIAKEDEDTVHDLVHDAFVLAFASLGNLRNNERFGEWGWNLTEDEIIVNGTPRKRLFIGDKNQIACVVKAIWVEGIGLNEDCWITLFDKHIGDYCYMSECYENGDCIFMTADFSKEGTSGLNMPKVNCPKNDSIFALQDRKRSCIKKGKIFIRNWKKHINRSI